MSYAITGASGQLGRLAAERLLSLVDPAEVVLLSRDTAKLSDLAARGATVRRADFTDAETLPTAFAGVDRLLLVSLDLLGEARRKAQRTAVDAAREAGVERVVYTSLPRPSRDNPAGVALDHLDTEEYLRAGGPGAVMLRNNLYSEFQLDSIRRAAETGRFVTNTGSGRSAYVTRVDCAAAAVGALVGDVVGEALDVTGPAALDAHDLAELASKTGGRAVEVVDVDDAAFVAGLQSGGMPQQFAELTASFGTAIREGWLADVTTTVRDLTGVEPTPLSDLLQV